MAFFSVIIPLYNKEQFIEATLNSVLSQVFGDFEIIIINDGSTDNSEQKVLAFSDSRIRYYSKENGGVSSARNLGMRYAGSDYITFIDADDYWYPEFLETMYSSIQKFPSEQVFSAAIEVASPKQVYAASYSIPDANEYAVVDYFKASQNESVIWTSCAVFHKKVFDVAGVFDPLIRSGEDIDLWVRIGLLYKIVFCNKILARYVYDAGSLSKDKRYSSIGMDFSKFEKQELQHTGLKQFLDLNRFSMAIKSKLNGDGQAFLRFYNGIDRAKLSRKKRILLVLPSFLLRGLVAFQYRLTDWGLVRSPFK